MIGTIFTLLETAIIMSVIILLVLLFFKHFGDRFTAKCRYIVWIIVILRLCVPFVGAFSPKLIDVDIPISETISNTECEAPSPEMTSDRYTATISETVLSSPLASETQNSLPITSQPATAPHEDNTKTGSESEIDTTYVSVFSLPALDVIIFTLYLTGAVIFLTSKLLSYNIYRKRLMRRRVMPGEEICRIYADVCKKLKIAKPPRLYISNVIGSPLLCGFFKPTIFLPNLNNSASGLNGVLTHELIHHTRGDLWIKLLGVIANSLFFFDPLVYAALSRLDCEMELSCDEKLLSGLESSARLSYGAYMLEIVRHSRRRESSLTTFCSPVKGAVKERFMNIIEEKTRNHGKLIIALVLILCTFAGSVIGCGIKKDEGTVPRGYFENGEVITLTPEILEFGEVSFERKGSASLERYSPSDNALSTFLNKNDLYIMSEHTSSRYSDYFELMYENGGDPVCIYAGNAEKADFRGKSFDKLFGESGFCFGYFVSNYVDIYFSTSDGKVPKPFYKTTKETSLIDLDRDGEYEIVSGNSISTTANGKAVTFKIDKDIANHFKIGSNAINIEFPYSTYNYIYRLSYNGKPLEDGSYTRYSAKMTYSDGKMTIEPEKSELVDTNEAFQTSNKSWKMYRSMKHNAIVLENRDKCYGYAVEKNANSISKDFKGKRFGPLDLASGSYAYISKDESRAAILGSTDYSSNVTFINLNTGDIISNVKNNYRDILKNHGLSDFVLAPYHGAYSSDGTTIATMHRFSFKTTLEELDESFKLHYKLISDDGKLSLSGDITYNFSSYAPDAYTVIETSLDGITDEEGVLNVQIKKDKYSDTVLYKFHNTDSKLMMYTSNADGGYFMPSVISPLPVSDHEYAQIVSFGNYDDSEILYMTVMTSTYDEETKANNECYFVYMANIDSMMDEKGEYSKPLIWNYSNEISITSAGSEKYGITKVSESGISINN